MYRISTLVDGFTHIYQDSLACSDGQVSRRCDRSVVVKISNTNEVDEDELKGYIQQDKICPECLRYKTGIVLE